MTTTMASNSDSGSSSSGSGEELDLDAELENLDMSKDFTSGISDDDDEDFNDDDKPSAFSTSSYPSWKEFMQHTEIFSKRFQPNKMHVQQIAPYAKALEVSTASGEHQSWTTMLTQSIAGPTAKDETLSILLDPAGPPPKSVVIRSGLVHYAGKVCELLILTHGFILLDAPPKPSTSSSSRPSSLFDMVGLGAVTTAATTTRHCHIVELWCNIQHLLAPPGEKKLLMLDEQDVSLEIEFESPKEQASYGKLLEWMLVEHGLHYAHDDHIDIKKFGWQYCKVYKPGYTAAVLNAKGLLLNPTKEALTTLDEYHQSTPLHYSLQVHHREPNLHLLEALLEAGADPNMEDGDGRSPMYFAEKNEWEEVKSLFQKFGGKPSRLFHDEQRGKLFGRAEVSAQKAEQRREEKAKEQAEAAKAAMSENMNLLRERGEKIEELGDKATELNENAAEFGSLAAQLKAKVHAKKWYQL